MIDYNYEQEQESNQDLLNDLGFADVSERLAKKYGPRLFQNFDPNKRCNTLTAKTISYKGASMLIKNRPVKSGSINYKEE